MLDSRAYWEQPITGRRRRSSSWDHSGANRDYQLLSSGETTTLMASEGRPGYVMRMWFTLMVRPDDLDLNAMAAAVEKPGPLPLAPDAGPERETFLAKVLLRFTFDGITTVRDVPFGMFIATGPWRVNDLNSRFVNVMRSRPRNLDMEGCGYGSFDVNWSMPFGNSATLELINNTQHSLVTYFHVDYVEDEGVGTKPLLFHARYNKVSLTTPDPETFTHGNDTVNLSNARNHLLADIRNQRGRYMGTVLAVDSQPDRAGKWYEGDDMFFVDGEPWPPSIHGTGTEDYFGMAWRVHRLYQAMDHGVTHYERNVTDHDRFYDGRFTIYRWHVDDPIEFQHSLHASLEAGHANDTNQHYESVAFWYGREG